MACPVCNRTMQNLGVTGKRVFWCHYCGTLKEEDSAYTQIEVPGHLKRLQSLVPGHQRGTDNAVVTVEYLIKEIDNTQAQISGQTVEDSPRSVL